MNVKCIPSFPEYCSILSVIGWIGHAAQYPFRSDEKTDLNEEPLRRTTGTLREDHGYMILLDNTTPLETRKIVKVKYRICISWVLIGGFS